MPERTRRCAAGGIVPSGEKTRVRPARTNRAYANDCTKIEPFSQGRPRCAFGLPPRHCLVEFLDDAF